MRTLLIIGLILRFLIMLSTLHGDLFFIWKGPAEFMTESVIAKKNYPPLSFLTFAAMSPLYFLAQRIGWWVLKLPYLLVDLAIIKLLFNLLSTKTQRRRALILWWLNPVVLFATYAQGQIEIIMAALLLLSVDLVRRNKYLALLAYSASVAYKTIPGFFLPPVAAYLGDNWRQRLKLFLLGISIPIILGFIFWKGLGFDVINSYFPKVARPQFVCGFRPDAIFKCAEVFIGFLGYVMVLVIGLRRKERVKRSAYARILFCAGMLYLIGSSVTVIHRYVMLMPLFVLWAVKREWNAKLVWGWLILLFLGFIYTWPLQEGLIKYWYPQAANKPALREWVAPLVNYEHIALLAKILVDIISLRFIFDLLWSYQTEEGEQ